MHGLKSMMGWTAMIVGMVWCASPVEAGDVIPVSRVRNPNYVMIGMNRIMFRDIPPAMMTSLAKPLQRLLESQTGLTGDVDVCPDAMCLAKKLHDGQVQIGVFHGFEFAWLKQQYPELEPLIVAVPLHKRLQAYLVTRKDAEVNQFASLDGQKVAIAKGTKEHCRLFLDRGKLSCEKQPNFELTNPESIEDALHDVVDGVVAATVVDAGAIASFKTRHPGRHAKLKIVEQSEVFPCSVVAYRKSTLDDTTLNRIRQGLTTAHLTAQGKSMMNLWKLGGFENVPANYSEQLANILKVYPPPANESKMK